MREILFRAKADPNFLFGDEKETTWVEGCPLFVNTGNGIFGGPGEDYQVIVPIGGHMEYGEVRKFYCILPETLGQYTGVKDKNGRKIFEGDIVTYKNAYGGFDGPDEFCHARIREEHIAVVNYNEEKGKFYPMPYCDICDDPWYSEANFDFEVIGNIHDNPELMNPEVKKDV